MNVCEWVFSGHVAANSNNLEEPMAVCLGMTKSHVCPIPPLICVQFPFTHGAITGQRQTLFCIVLPLKQDTGKSVFNKEE